MISQWYVKELACEVDQDVVPVNKHNAGKRMGMSRDKKATVMAYTYIAQHITSQQRTHGHRN